MHDKNKPLFRPEAIAPKLRSFILPERCAAVRPKLIDWAKKLVSGKLDKKKETELLPDYLSDIFSGLLGYAGPVSGSGTDAYTIKRESLVEVDGKRAHCPGPSWRVSRPRPAGSPRSDRRPRTGCRERGEPGTASSERGMGYG